VPLRAAPAGIAPVVVGMRAAGRAAPVRHYGSVDVFLEAFEHAEAGDVLVVDNGGRADEACIGDLAVLEARAAGLAGVVVWGLHRDTVELRAIGMPVFSYGTYAPGPVRLDPQEPDALASAHVGAEVVTRGDAVFADDDGVVFVALDRLDVVLDAAQAIQEKEREQARLIAGGTTLREQTSFDEYLARRGADATYTFRKHLRTVGGAIEE
jgi:regulator of RNase E activity RraA